MRLHCNLLALLGGYEAYTSRPRVNLGDTLRQYLDLDYASIMAPGYPGSPRTVGRSTQNNSFDKVFRFLGQLRESTKVYADLAARDNGITKPDWMRWEQDQRDLKDLNHYATGVAARMINSFIIPMPKMAMPSLSKSAGVVERVAWELFDNVGPNGMEDTWGKIAQGQVRAFTGILRSMQDVRTWASENTGRCQIRR